MQYLNVTLQAHKKFQISPSITEHTLMAFWANIKIKFITKEIQQILFWTSDYFESK